MFHNLWESCYFPFLLFILYRVIKVMIPLLKCLNATTRQSPISSTMDFYVTSKNSSLPLGWLPNTVASFKKYINVVCYNLCFHFSFYFSYPNTKYRIVSRFTLSNKGKNLFSNEICFESAVQFSGFFLNFFLNN